MSISLSRYFSKAVVSCFEGEPIVEPVVPPVVDPAGPPAEFTPEQQRKFNEALAADRRKEQQKYQASLLKTEQTYKEMLANNQNLSAKERQTLEENLVTIQGQLRTKEEQAKMEMKSLETNLTAKIKENEEKAAVWENRYKSETITRSLQDAAGSDAFEPSQIVSLLKPMTRLVEVVDEQTGKATGNFKAVVDFPDSDADGNPVISTFSPQAAVKRMKDIPARFGNLFKSNVVSGIGANNNAGGAPGGKPNLAKMTPEQYRAHRKANPL